MKRRLALLALLLLVTLIPALSARNATAGATPAVALRVLSFNMHTGIGTDGRLDLAATARFIRHSGADVIGLQEVDVHWSARSEFRDQAADLAASLNMRVFFAPIYDLPPPADGQPRRQYGVAVLSRYPIVHAENHWITRLSTQDPNPVPRPAPGFPEVVVLVRGAPVHVYVTHLDYRPDPTVRAMQVADMLEILDRDRHGATQLLLGDFNAEPDAPELAPLWTRLRDAWCAGTGTGLTYPAGVPVKRIDYVTVSGRAYVRHAEVPATLVSDHRPVLADLLVWRGHR